MIEGESSVAERFRRGGYYMSTFGRSRARPNTTLHQGNNIRYCTLPHPIVVTHQQHNRKLITYVGGSGTTTFRINIRGKHYIVFPLIGNLLRAEELHTRGT